MTDPISIRSLDDPAPRLLVCATEAAAGQVLAATFRRLGFAAGAVFTRVADAIEELEGEGAELLVVEVQPGRIDALEAASLIHDLGLPTRLALVVDGEAPKVPGRLPVLHRAELEDDEGRARAAATLAQAAAALPARLYPRDFLFLAAVCRCSAALRFLGVCQDGGEAEVEVVDGAVWNAYCGDFLGEAGVERLAWQPLETVLVRPLARRPERRQVPIDSTALTAAVAPPGGGGAVAGAEPAVSVAAAAGGSLTSSAKAAPAGASLLPQGASEFPAGGFSPASDDLGTAPSPTESSRPRDDSRPSLRLAPSLDQQAASAEAAPAPRRPAVDAICQQLVQESSGGRACSVISLPDGHLLGTAGFGSETLREAMVEAALSLLSSPQLHRLDRQLEPGGAEEPLHHAFLAASRFSFVVEALPTRHAAILLLTDPTDKPGLLRADLRRAQPDLLAALG